MRPKVLAIGLAMTFLDITPKLQSMKEKEKITCS